MWASPRWMDFCGYSHEELQGQTLRILHGDKTERASLDAIARAVAQQQWPCTVELTNYTKARTAFRHRLTLEPLRNGQGVPIVYRARSSCVCPLEADDSTDEAELCSVLRANEWRIEEEELQASLATCQLSSACVAK